MTCVHMVKFSLNVTGTSSVPASAWHTFIANYVLFIWSTKNRFIRNSRSLKQIRLDMNYQVLKLFL